MKRYSQSGQVTVEAMLIITLLFTVVTLAVNSMRQRSFVARLVEQPWTYLGGMIQNGVWLPPEQGRDLHPNHLSRHASPEGDTL